MKSSKKIIVYAIAVVLVIIFFSGCAMQSIHKKRAMDFYRSGDYDKAVEYLEMARKEKPSTELNTLLFRAKLNSYFYHLNRARTLKDVDKKEEAVKEYKIALEIFPDNKKLIDEVELYLNPEKKEKKPFIPTVLPPVTLNVDPRETMTLNLRNIPITKIFQALGKSYGVNFIFDKDFRDFVYNIEVEKIGFYEALKQLCMVGSADYRILDKSSVLIYPSTTFKQRTFGLRGVKVFYLANSAADDVKKLLMAVFRDQQILVQEDKNLNTLIIKADYSTLAEIERFILSIDKSKGEVAIDVEILEVTKNYINALGVNFGDVKSPVATIAAGVVGADGAIKSTFNLKDIKGTNFFLTVPSAALSFLESDDRSRLIAKPNLRGVDGEEIKFMVGDEVPVPQTSFQAGAAGGFSNIPVTTYQYRNVGVDIKLTPFIHNDNEVTIKIKLTINSIAGSQGDFPIFGKRELENIIRLKEGETNIIGGFIKDEFRKGMQGFPALSRLPILGKLFGASGKEIKETDLIFSITPRIIRQVEVTAVDQEAIWSNVDVAPPGIMEAPGEGPGEGVRSPEIGRPGGDSVIIAPAKRRLPVNSTSIFTLRVNTSTALASLSISGSVSGGEATIEEAKTDSFFGGQKVQVMANTSGTSFDLGYTFPETLRSIGVVAQLRIKFASKGNYTISLGGISAMSKDRQTISLTSNTAEIEVY